MGERVRPAHTSPNTGTKTENPKKKRVSWKSVAFGMVFLTMIAGGVSLGWYFNKNMSVRSVEVRGNVFTSAEQILGRAAIPIGTPSEEIPFMKAIENVEKLPYVKDAAIRRYASGKIGIHVTERIPIGMAIHANRRAYFDEDGVILPILPGNAADVPLIYGLPFGGRTDTLKSDAFLKVRDFLRETRQNAVAFSTISEVAWTQSEGVVALSHENGIRVVFGTDRFSQGVENWSLFYTQVVAIRGPRHFNTVDLRYQGQIVTRES